MNLYLDSSALVKRYIGERDSRLVAKRYARASRVATAMVTRAEVSAALSRAVRMGVLSRGEAIASLDVFRREWPSLSRLQISEEVAAGADELAWKHGLRGYDAVQLACACAWRDGIASKVEFLSFDRDLNAAAREEGLSAI